jgi:outer membrane protein TolC
MKLKFFAIGLLIPFFAIVSPAQPPAERVITLQECLKLALENSPRLKINALEQTKLNYQYKETAGAGLPHINMAGSFDDYVSLPTQLIPGEFFGRPGELIPVQFGTTYNLAGGLDASQIIYNQTYLISLRMAKLAMDQNRLMSEREKIEVVFDVAQSFYYAQISLRQIRNRQDNLKKLEKAEQIARSQYENGLIKKVDVDRIVVNKLNVQTDIDRLQLMYEQQMNAERYFMGLGLNEPIAFPDTVVRSKVDLTVQGDLSGHIDIRMIEKQKQLALSNLRLDQSAYYPSLNLIAALQYTNSSNTYYVFGKSTDWFNTSLVGIRLHIPIFSGLQRMNKVNQSRINLDQLRISEDNTRRWLGVQSKDAASKLVNAITDEQRQSENMKLAERVYGISQEQYQKGVITLTDLLNAESGLTEAQTNHSLALVQMKIAELEYLRANGKLLSIIDN